MSKKEGFGIGETPFKNAGGLNPDDENPSGPWAS